MESHDKHQVQMGFITMQIVKFNEIDPSSIGNEEYSASVDMKNDDIGMKMNFLFGRDK